MGDQKQSVETLVVTDLDGSFWGRDLRCHPDTLAAVTELESSGVPLLIATGRREGSARWGLDLNGVSAPAVLLNGALGVDLPTDTRFHTRPFAPVDAEAVIEALAEVRLSPVVYTEDGRVRGGRDVTTGTHHMDGFGNDFVTEDPFATVRARSILSFSMIGLSRSKIEPAVEALANVGADALMYEDHLHQAWSVHIQPVEVSKWVGIESYLDYAGLAPERVIVVGDGTNDMEMLRKADVALGVEGGHSEPLAVADHVIGHPDDGGWATVLDHL